MFGGGRYLAVIMVLMLMVLSACDPGVLPERYMYGLETITPSGKEDFLNYESDVIFNQDSLLTFELLIPEEAKAFLDADPAAEDYVPAMVVFQGDTIGPVAARYKGSIGSFAGCLSGNDVATPSGSKVCTKLSMKVDFTYYQDDYKFYKLNKLQFNSMNHDHSQMHERLGYYLFKQMGVPAPRCVHARLIINGEYSGLYALVEQVDEQFAVHNFTDGGGNVYKEVWPTDSKAKAYNERFYLNHLKTNQDKQQEDVMIEEFGCDIENAELSEMKLVISKWMDINVIISYAVVDRAIRADDGPFHWYENNGRIYNHNYFWYEEPSIDKLFLIPYDLDNAFENIKEINNPITAIADGWGELSADCKPFEYAESGKKQRSAACDKLCGGWMSFDEEYEELKTFFINDVFSEEKVNALLDQWENQIRSATKEADVLHDDALNIFAWEAALLYLKESLAYARNQ